MKLIVCTDSRNGIMFNGRRQSRDSAVCEDILAMTGDQLLYTDSYSFELFRECADNRVICSAEPAAFAGSEDYCFAEKMDLAPAADKADTVIVYCWNKNYPADMYFDVEAEAFRLVSETELKGSSHEKITKRIYKK